MRRRRVTASQNPDTRQADAGGALSWVVVHAGRGGKGTQGNRMNANTTVSRTKCNTLLRCRHGLTLPPALRTGTKELTERTGVQVYFADPHSPWQRGSNENTKAWSASICPRGQACRSISKKS